jgi:hypothetical protein
MRAWALWWFGVLLVPLAGIVMVAAKGHCAGFWPTDIVTHQRCVGLVPGIVWAMWLAAFAAMTIGMLGLERASLRAVAIAQLFAGLAFAATPTMPTADAYQYHVYGDASRTWSPWQPSRLVPDRESTATGLRIWGNPPQPSPYGPLFVLYERGLLAAFPALGADQLIYVERSVDVFALLAMTLLLRGPRIAWWALHPLVLFEFAVAAHCDVLMLLLLAISIRSRSAILAGVAIGASGMIKLVGLGASAFRIGALPSALVTVAVFLALFPAAATLAPQQAATIGFGGSPALLAATLLKAMHVPGAEAIARWSVVLAGVITVCALRVQRRDVPVHATLLLIGCSTWIVPWYLTWVVFAARFAHRRAAIAAYCIASGSLVLESVNQVSPHTELAAAVVFLLLAGLSLRYAWSHGAVPTLVRMRPLSART